MLSEPEPRSGEASRSTLRPGGSAQQLL